MTDPGVAAPLKVLIFAGNFRPASRGGGPIRTIDALIRAAPRTVDIAVLTSDLDTGVTDRLEVQRNSWTTFEGLRVYYGSPDSLRSVVKIWRNGRAWRPDVVYLNSFFSPVFSIGPQFLARLGWWRGAEMLIAPRGEFNRGALALSRRRKKLYLWLYRFLRMPTRNHWHASSTDEAKAIRETFSGRNVSVLVRENDTSLPVAPSAPIPARGDRLRAVFLGRISPIKGVDVMVRAMSMTTLPIIVDIFGPPEDPSYLALCQGLARNISAQAEVTFRGPIAAEDARTLLAEYEVLLMPTDGENFGHVIAESLSVSCPVMCTPYTPWTGRLLSGGGVVVPDRTPEAWAEAIEDYCRLSSDDRDRRRIAAGEAYRRWRAEPKGPHIFELLQAELAGSRPSAG
jgi:glycosyltransferase involved in cell wall biosynthesis